MKVNVLRNVVALFFLVSSLTAGCSAMGNTSTPASNPVVTTENNIVSASAKLVPITWANLGFSAGGTNLVILVQPGDIVEAGQVLARVNQDSLKQAVEQAKIVEQRAQLALQQIKDLPSEEAVAAAKAALASAEVAYDRLDRSNARQIELDAAQAQVDSARLALQNLESGATDLQLQNAQLDLDSATLAVKQAEAALANTEIQMPFNGRIVEVYYRDGEYVAPAQPVFLVANLSEMQIETTDLSEVDAARISPGDKVSITFDALPDIIVTGKVVRIADKASPGSAVNFTVIIEPEIIPDNARWGMTAFVEISIK